jgi:hypothetical protein
MFRSVDPNNEDPSSLIEEYSNEYGEVEKRMQDEVKTDADLLGLYRYDDNVLRIYADKVVFSWEEDSSRYRERKLTGEEFKKITEFVSENELDKMAPLITCSGNDDYGEGRNCTPHQLLMLGKHGGRRLFFLNEEPPKIVAALDRIFKEFREAPSKQKYLLSKKLPGLEVLLADDSFEVLTVWKNNGDLRVAGGDADRSEKIEAEIRNLAASDNYAPEKISELVKLRASKLANSVGWRSVENERLGGPAAEPPGFELVSAYSAEPWNARTNASGLSSRPGGIYRVAGAKQTLIAAGNFTSPVATSDGRWAVAMKFGDGKAAIVRINLMTNKELTFPSIPGNFSIPVAAIPGTAKVLLYERTDRDYEDGESRDSNEATDLDPTAFQVVDAETGTVQPARGEFRPLAQQSFRKLQSSSNGTDYWAAIPDLRKHTTQVGVYNARSFTFKSVLEIPEIVFDSMKMWVDENERKVYFVYRSQLLALPLPK